jgi:enoyl-CoA hydratase/carnithine racemase
MLLDIEKHGAVRLIRMKHGPENRFNREFVDDLLNTLNEFEKDKSVSALVFTGAHPKYFCNGLDLNWMAKQSVEILNPFLDDWCKLLYTTFGFKKPIIAGINGHAFAGGMFFSMAMDWKVMREDKGWICAPEVDIGMTLPPSHSYILAHASTTSYAERVSITGERLIAKKALEFGFVDVICPFDKVVNLALEKAAELGKKNKNIYRDIKLGYRSRVLEKMKTEDIEYFENIRLENKRRINS